MRDAPKCPKCGSEAVSTCQAGVYVCMGCLLEFVAELPRLERDVGVGM